MSNSGASFFDDTNAFGVDSIEKGNKYIKLMLILLKFIVDKERAFSLAFRLLNVDEYYFPIRLTLSVQT